MQHLLRNATFVKKEMQHLLRNATFGTFVVKRCKRCKEFERKLIELKIIKIDEVGRFIKSKIYQDQETLEL